MDPQKILDYMDDSIKNAESCFDILIILGMTPSDREQHQGTINEMIVSRAKFWEANQKELG